ncbi:MAG: thioredoxin [Anaerovoracaceae bacterium]|nr:thioredoxin [Bacillota bacterium]MDY3954298.1 thioredoxin [Anaerovoracaceae bacterium]
MSDKIVYLTPETYEEEVNQCSVPVVIDFYADWCGPCQALSPVMEALAEKYGDRVKICKIDIDAHRKLAVSNKVLSIPTLFFLKNGELSKRVTGALAQPECEEIINSLL